MASSGLQLLGFMLSLIGLAATVASVFMVEWEQELSGSSHHTNKGLWMECMGEEKVTCESYDTIMDVPHNLQVTRAVIVSSIFLASVAMLVSILGMKCTHFMDGKPESKSRTAMVGGILLLISGVLTFSITSWYVRMIVDDYNHSHHNHLHSTVFGKAVFVSWAGGLLTMAGGLFLSCRRCSRASNNENVTGNHLYPNTNQSTKSNYV